MNNHIKYTFRTGILAAAGLLALYSCSDTWDEHYNGTATSGTQFQGTTMQAIEQQAPDFAEVLRAVGFDRELNSANTYTVWAPTSGFDKAALIAQARTDSAEVVKRFVQNHVARYNVSLGLEPQQVTLLNTKLLTMSGLDEHKIGDVNISASQNNIKCNNGLLHIIDGRIPFQNNIFELIEEEYGKSTNATKTDISLYSFLKGFNQDSLLEAKSVSRGVDENGEKIWVDSVTLRNNTILKNIDALIYEEDSNYIALIPSVEAYQERYAQAKELLKFNPNMDKGLDYKRTDSLQNYYANMFVMRDLFYNRSANEFWEDSLKSTVYSPFSWPNGLYYRNTDNLHHALPEDKEVNDILATVGLADSITCSNGIAYLFDEYPMSIYEQFFAKQKVMASEVTYVDKETTVGTVNLSKSVGSPQGINMTWSGVPVLTRDVLLDEEGQPVVDEETGETQYVLNEVNSYSKQVYYFDVQPSSSNVNPSAGFQIPNNLSGTYDLYIVTTPYWVNNSLSSSKGYRFYAYIWEQNDDGSYPTRGTQLTNPADGTTTYETPALRFLPYDDGNDETFTIAMSDTTLLGSYTFKYAYYGQTDPGVYIQITTNISARLTDQYSREMLITGFLLKPHKDTEVAEEPQPVVQVKQRDLQTIINNKNIKKYAALQ